MIFSILLYINNLWSPPTVPVPLNTFRSDLTSIDFLIGKNDYRLDSNFVEIPAAMTFRPGMYILNETWEAYSRMYEAAKAEGIPLKIMSAARTFDEQKWLWEDKWNLNKLIFPTDSSRAAYILRFSAMPGTSRHHWGTDIDLNSTSEKYFATAEGSKVYKWLMMHACDFGFCQTYDEMGVTRTNGYRNEPWHWSYYPLAGKLQIQYAKTIDYHHITGFNGAGVAESLEVIQKYVLSVSSDCIQ